MKAIGNVVACFVSIIYFVVLLVMMLFAFASNLFSPDYYKGILDNFDLSEVKLADFGIDSLGEKFNENSSIEDVIVTSLEDVGISKNDAINIVNNEKINEIAGSLISDTMNYLATKENLPQIKTEDVKEIVNTKEISSVLEKVPSDAEIETFVGEINKYVKDALEGGSEL